MKEVYRSKIGIAAIGAVLFGFIPLGSLIYTQNVIGAVIAGLVITFIIYMFATTNYSIDNTTLLVKCGFYKVPIDINSIERIEDTNSLFSAPALSLTGRILISYSGGKNIVISPVRKEDFCKKLKQINPKISLRLIELLL